MTRGSIRAPTPVPPEPGAAGTRGGRRRAGRRSARTSASPADRIRRMSAGPPDRRRRAPPAAGTDPRRSSRTAPAGGIHPPTVGARRRVPGADVASSTWLWTPAELCTDGHARSTRGRRWTPVRTLDPTCDQSARQCRETWPRGELPATVSGRAGCHAGGCCPRPGWQPSAVGGGDAPAHGCQPLGWHGPDPWLRRIRQCDNRSRRFASRRVATVGGS